MPFSIAVPSFNDGKPLRRFLHSAVGTRGLDEIVVVDHRSADDTPEILVELEPVLSAGGIRLTTHRERRDFSGRFTMASLRALTVRLCTNDIVCTMDADYVIGPGLSDLMELATRVISENRVYAVGHDIPYLQPPIVFDESGVLQKHGPCYRHGAIPRIVLRDSVECRQDYVRGRFYKFYPHTAERPYWMPIRWLPESVISINDKPDERWRLRLTMNNYLESISQTPSLGDVPWLESFAKGDLDTRIDPLDYFHPGKLWDTSLEGQRYHVSGIARASRDAVAPSSPPAI